MHKHKMSVHHQPLFPHVIGLDRRLERQVLKLAEREDVALVEITAVTQDSQKFTAFYFLLPDRDIFGVGVDSRGYEACYAPVREACVRIMSELVGGLFSHKTGQFSIRVSSPQVHWH